MNHDLVNSLFTIKDFILWGKIFLDNHNLCYGHGYFNSFEEIKSLIFSVINLPLNELLTSDLLDMKLSNEDKYILINLIKKRTIYNIPVAYLIKQSCFAHQIFYIDNRVIIPRSSISELIERKFLSIFNKSNNPKYILDLCTGSGCIAICCAYYFKTSKIDAVDISTSALEVAEININNHNLENRIYPIYSNLFERLPCNFYDLIITNPPYLNLQDLSYLPKEYFYEPQISLYGGSQNGLKILHLILKNAYKYLTKQGILICEAGHNLVNLKSKYPNIIFNEFKLSNKTAGIFYLSYQQLGNIQSNY